MYTFPTHSITILRKMGDDYSQVAIITDSRITGSSLSPEENRKNVISRLRKDPSVFLVMEPRNGHCDEEAAHYSGFVFHVEADEGEKPSAHLRVTFKDSVAYEEHFSGEDDQDESHDQFDPLWTVLGQVGELLMYIEHGVYDFVLDSCPYFVKKEPAEPVDLYEARDIITNAGFQTERISVLSGGAEPLLFVHENDIVLLGSRHFDGERLFVEMKRFLRSADTKAIEDAAERAGEFHYGIRVIHWDDGSWSFRRFLDEDLDKNNFLERLEYEVSELKAFINGIESRDNVGSEPWNMMSEQRHFFIHETLTESGKLSKLLI